jgi:hypothetical protein
MVGCMFKNIGKLCAVIVLMTVPLLPGVASADALSELWASRYDANQSEAAPLDNKSLKVGML